MSVLVRMLIGGEAYVESARISLEALLADSPFNIVVVHTPGLEAPLPMHPRLQRLIIPAIPPTAHRADRFLQKFDAIKLCLEHSLHDWIIQLDADVLLARPITEKDVVSALAGAKLGMVEQTTVTGSGMNRSSFLGKRLINRSFLSPFNLFRREVLRQQGLIVGFRRGQRQS